MELWTFWVHVSSLVCGSFVSWEGDWQLCWMELSLHSLARLENIFIIIIIIVIMMIVIIVITRRDVGSNSSGSGIQALPVPLTVPFCLICSMGRRMLADSYQRCLFRGVWRPLYALCFRLLSSKLTQPGLLAYA